MILVTMRVVLDMTSYYGLKKRSHYVTSDRQRYLCIQQTRRQEKR